MRSNQDPRRRKSGRRRKPPQKPVPEGLPDLDRELTHGFAAGMIRRKAKQLIRHGVLDHCDREDLVQELTLNLLRRLPKFDAKKAHWNAFVATVVERHSATILKAGAALKRGSDKEMISLSTLMEGEEGQPVPLGTLLENDSVQSLRGTSLSDVQRIQLRHDVDAVLARLPDDLREVCERLKIGPRMDVARVLGLPRRTIRSKIKIIREAFEALGFTNIL